MVIIRNLSQRRLGVGKDRGWHEFPPQVPLYSCNERLAKGGVLSACHASTPSHGVTACLCHHTNLLEAVKGFAEMEERPL